MSHYADYVHERTEDHVFETAEGFATYRYLDNNGVYIVDIYVAPGQRKTGIAAYLADEIVKMAKVRGCKELFGSVVPSAKGSTASLKVLLGYGMALHSSADNFIVFRKEI